MHNINVLSDKSANMRIIYMKNDSINPQFGHKYDGDYFGTLQTGEAGTGNCHTHLHDFFEIIYQIEGNRTYYIKQEKVTLNPGDVVIIPPGTSHSTLLADEYFSAYVYCYIPEIIYSWELSLYNIKYLLAFSEEIPPKRCIFRGDSELLCEMRNEIKQLMSYDNRPEMELVARASIIKIHYLAYNLFGSDCNDLASEFLSSVLRVIENNFDSDISPYYIAEQLHISYSHLCHKLKAEFGTTPNHLIMRYRLAYAEKLLINRRDMSITDISYDIGIKDTSYFIKCFKRYRGVTPMQYRDSECSPDLEKINQ